jgi:tetratricopeptide (TPR) repeat protein
MTEGRYTKVRISLAAALTTIVATIAAGCVSSPAPTEQADAPRDANALLMGAEMALQKKEYLESARLFAAAAQASDDDRLTERATSTAYENFQSTYALKSAERWLAINSSSEEAHRYAGFAALRLYKIDTAVEHFESLLQNAFISPAAGFMALAPQWFEVGSRPAVFALAQILAGKHPQVAEAHLVLAQAAMQAENLAVALSSAQKATELSPYLQPARSLLARVQLASGQTDTALATIRAMMEQEKTPEQRLEYAQMLYAAGKEEEGRKELDQLADSPEVGAGAQRTLALVQLDAGEWEGASKRWRELVQGGRFVYEGLYYLGQIAERRGENSDAIELYSRVTNTELAVASQSRAALLRARAGTAEDGLAALRAYGSEHGEFAIEMIVAQASLLTELGQGKQGVKLLDEAIADYPDRDDLLASKALLLEREKRTGEALKTMRELSRIRPDDPTALNMLGYTLVDRTRDIEEGLAMIRRALTAMPDNGAILDSMGWALHKLKRNEEALGYLQRAHDRARDPDIALHLGDVQWALGRTDDARTTWQDALERTPDDKELKERVEKRKAK